MISLKLYTQILLVNKKVGPSPHKHTGLKALTEPRGMKDHRPTSAMSTHIIQDLPVLRSKHVICRII